MRASAPQRHRRPRCRGAAPRWRLGSSEGGGAVVMTRTWSGQRTSGRSGGAEVADTPDRRWGETMDDIVRTGQADGGRS
ncbi:hypothetical protein ACFSM7_01095 [Clavibacter michiganensis subsp. tessellarius]|uniref:hypothetical protein n=1 Tax=Clavibacter tessellarius TaxID=31965 RepID=UPI00363B0ED0